MIDQRWASETQAFMRAFGERAARIDVLPGDLVADDIVPDGLLDIAFRGGIVQPELRRGADKAQKRPVDKPDSDDPTGQAATDVVALAPVNPASLDGLSVPERRWLVPDWIPMFRATSLYSAGGEGKTLLGQMLATACATDARWLGLHVHRCNSLLVFCEDDQDEMHRRQADINAHYGCDFADLGAMRWLPRLGDDNALMTFSEGRGIATPLLDQVLAAAKEHAAQLVIVDTLADVFTGNESDRAQARTFAQSVLGYLAREIGGAVLALAHPSRAGMTSGSGESGSTSWIGTFRSQLYLSTPKAEEGEAADPDLRVLTRKKSNAARRDELIEMRWKNGVFLATAAPTGILGSIERRACERVFLDLLDKLSAEGRRVSENQRASNYAPRLFAGRPERERYRQGDFKSAMERLFSAGDIAIGVYRNPDRHDYPCIVRSGAGGSS
jgi:RecA-family ATPase